MTVWKGRQIAPRTKIVTRTLTYDTHIICLVSPTAVIRKPAKIDMAHELKENGSILECYEN